MGNKRCKNKKCQKILPEGYKHFYCENCINEHVKVAKNIGKVVLSTTVLVAGTAVSIATKGKINLRKK